jgi:SAM-dependent methyltransferase
MDATSGQPMIRLYDEFADWWTLLSAPADYEEEASFYTALIAETAAGPVSDVLELGSGGGNNASFLKHSFRMTLVDLSPRMLEVSKRLNPECEHLEGDMRTVRLGRTFDAVFIHDAIMYMTSEDDLRAAIQTAWEHLRPGGAAVFAPDAVREHFKPATDHGGHDEDGRSLRYLEFSHDPDPSDTTYVVDYAYLLKEADGSARVEHDRHIEGIFPRDTWLRLLRETGFEPRVHLFDHSEIEPGTYEIFAARRP